MEAIPSRTDKPRNKLYTMAITFWLEQAREQGRGDTIADFISFLKMYANKGWQIQEEEAADIEQIYNNIVRQPSESELDF